ncbi:MAG: potassium channel family protein [Herbiconiux sp.]|nr:potassium channel family protein [Herbiconiux sp.]
MTTSEQQRRRWETVTALPLVALSLVFLTAYSVRVLDPSLPGKGQAALNILIAAIWALFAADYLVRLGLAHDRGAFFRSAFPDLLSVLVPVFRPFILLSRLKDIPYFQRRSGASVRGRLVIHAALFVVLFVYSISLAVLAAERGQPGANIESFGDAVWWACVTIATVGYGDFYPVTALGRFLAVILMFGGIAIVGVATATIVSYLGDSIRRQRR